MNVSQTILVVDDKANIRNLVRDYLEAEGYRMVVAANGRDALYAARQVKPELILLDIMMPEMSGYDFLRRTLRRPDHRCRLQLGVGADIHQRL